MAPGNAPAKKLTHWNLLDTYRKKDKPNQRSLASWRLRNYIRKNEYKDEADFVKRFKFENAKELLSSGGAAGEKAMLTKLAVVEDSKFAGFDLKNQVMTSVTKAGLESYLAHTVAPKLKEQGKTLTASEKNQILQAYDICYFVQNIALRRLKLEAALREQREKTSEGVMDKMRGSFGNALNKFGKNWDKLSGNEQLVVAGAALFGFLMLVKSDKPWIKKARDMMWTAGKVGLGLVVANIGSKALFGKSLMDYAGKWAEDARSASSFWKKSFPKAKPKGISAFAKGTIFMKNIPTHKLFSWYKARKRNSTLGVASLGLSPSEMSSEEVMLALETFDGRYDIRRLEADMKKNDKNYKKMKWQDTIASTVAYDGRHQFQSSEKGGVVAHSVDYAKRGGRWVSATVSSLYGKTRNWFKGKPEVKKKFQKEVATNMGTQEQLRRSFDNPSVYGRSFAHNLKMAYSTMDSAGAGMHYNAKEKAYYLVAKYPINIDKPSKFAKDKLPAPLTAAINRYQLGGVSHVKKFGDVLKLINVGNEQKRYVMLRVPRKGMTEHMQRRAGKWPYSNALQWKDSPLFFKDDAEKLEKEWTPEQIDNFRYKFGLKPSDVHRVMRTIEEKYSARGITRKKLVEILTVPDKEKDLTVWWTTRYARKAYQAVKDWVSGEGTKKSRERGLRLAIYKDVKAYMGSTVPPVPSYWNGPEKTKARPYLEAIQEAEQKAVNSIPNLDATSKAKYIAELRSKFGTRVRLAIMGDQKARTYIKAQFDGFSNFASTSALCKKYHRKLRDHVSSRYNLRDGHWYEWWDRLMDNYEQR